MSRILDFGFWILDKNKRQKILRPYILVILLISNIQYPTSCFAGSGASFLKIPIGARAIGMGSAATALSEDLTALYWNPAGLNGVQSKEFGFMHSELFEGTRLEFAGVAIPKKIIKDETSSLQPRPLTLGIGVTYLHQQAMEGRNENRAKTGEFSASDAALSFAGSAQISRRSSLGLGFKILRQSIQSQSTLGWALDFGILTRTPKLNLGVTFLNFGPTMRFSEENYSLPVTFAIGAGYRLASYLTLSADLKHYPSEKKSSFAYGMEIPVSSVFALRAGYLTSLTDLKNANSGGNSLQQMAGINSGIGIKFLKFSLDYAFTPMGDLGAAHRVSLLYRY